MSQFKCCVPLLRHTVGGGMDGVTCKRTDDRYDNFEICCEFKNSNRQCIHVLYLFDDSIYGGI
jgi:hypothetical protein